MPTINPFFAWSLGSFIVVFCVVLVYCKINDYTLSEALDSVREFFGGLFSQ